MQTETMNERYFYDGANVVADYDGTGTLLATYVTPFLDQNLLVTNYQVQSTNYFFHDGLGSVRNILNSNQAVQNSYDYYAFGEALNWAESVANRYAYTGREWDKESQTYHYRARNYSPFAGRFSQRDPIEYKDNTNIYSYVSNSPIRMGDLFGEAMTEVFPEGKYGKPTEYVASDCCGKKGCNLYFNFIEATQGTFLTFNVQKTTRYWGLNVRLSISDKTGCCCCKKIKIIQVDRVTDINWITSDPIAEVTRTRSDWMQRIWDPVSGPQKFPSTGWFVDSELENEGSKDFGNPWVDELSISEGHTGSFSTDPASFKDTPAVQAKGQGEELYSCAVCETYLGKSIAACINWGFIADNEGNVKFKPYPPIATSVIPQPVTDAINRWNRLSKVAGRKEKEIDINFK